MQGISASLALTHALNAACASLAQSARLLIASLRSLVVFASSFFTALTSLDAQIAEQTRWSGLTGTKSPLQKVQILYFCIRFHLPV
jgi:hypothetical protein